VALLFILLQPGVIPPNSVAPIVASICAFTVVLLPVVNPFITLFTISAYRRALFSHFCKA
jgi:hypothetical protein